MKLRDEHEMIRDTIRRLVQNEYPPEKIRMLDEEDKYPRDLLGHLAPLGMTGLTFSEEYGGSGRDIIAAIVICEELARRSLALCWTYVEAAFYGGEIISKLGDIWQKKFYLPQIAEGKILFAYALTEPNVGSDTASVQTKAQREKGKFIVNGTKMFISGAGEADYFIVLVRTDPTVKKYDGLSMILVDGKTPGILIRELKKLGVHGSSTCEVVFEDVRVPVANVLGGIGEINKGWGQLLKTLDIEHIEVAAGALGLAQGAFEESLKYAKERRQFGQSIGNFQAIAHKLAEMETEIFAARLLVYHVAELAQNDQPCWKESAMAKYYTAEVAKKVCLNGLQIHGSYGYMMEYDIQRYLRDSLMLTIGGGTAEILKNVIAKTQGLMK